MHRTAGVQHLGHSVPFHELHRRDERGASGQVVEVRPIMDD